MPSSGSHQAAFMSHCILLFQTYNVDGVPDTYLVSARPTSVTADPDYLPMGPLEGPQVTQFMVNFLKPWRFRTMPGLMLGWDLLCTPLILLERVG